MPLRGKIEESVIYAREALQISNLIVLKDLALNGAFLISTDAKIDPFVMGAWLRICQLQGVVDCEKDAPEGFIRQKDFKDITCIGTRKINQAGISAIKNIL